jgi:hypothetical protein
MNETMNANRKSGVGQVLGAMVLYVVLLAISIWLLTQVRGSVWQYLVVLLPVLPVVLLVRGLVQVCARWTSFSSAFSLGHSALHWGRPSSSPSAWGCWNSPDSRA